MGKGTGTVKKRKVTDENELEPDSNIPTASKKKRKVYTSSHINSRADGGTAAAQGDTNSGVEQSNIAEQFAAVQGQRRVQISEP